MRRRKFKDDDEGISHVIEFITSFIIFITLLTAFYTAVGVQIPKSNLIDLNERMKLVRVGNMLVNEEGQMTTGPSNWEDFIERTDGVNKIGRIGFAYSDQMKGVLSLKKIDAIRSVLGTGNVPLEKALYNKTRELMSLDGGQYFNIEICTIPGFINDASFEESANTPQWAYRAYGNWSGHYEGGRSDYWSTEGKNSYSLSWKPIYDSKESMYPSFVFNGSTWLSRMYYTGYDDGNARILSAYSTDNITWIKEKTVKIDIGGTYDKLNATSPFVLKLSDGSYRMYYAGNDKAYSRILSAISVDGGVTWNKEGGVRVDRGSMYDSRHASMPSTYKFSESSYIMYYGGYDGTKWRILNATSVDGLSWTKQGPSINIGGEYDKLNAYSPSVIKLSNNTYQMFYVGMDASLRSNITSAWSDNGIYWKKSNVAYITPGSLPINITSCHITAIPNGTYRMYYTESDGINSRVLSAFSKEGIVWTKEGGIRIDKGGAAASTELCKISTWIDLTNTMGIMFDIATMVATQKNLFNYSVILSNSTSSQTMWNKMDIESVGTQKDIYINTSDKSGWYMLEIRIKSTLLAGEYGGESVERRIYIDNFRQIGKSLLDWGRHYEKVDSIHSYSRIVSLYDENSKQYIPANVVITLFRGLVKL